MLYATWLFRNLPNWQELNPTSAPANAPTFTVVYGSPMSSPRHAPPPAKYRPQAPYHAATDDCVAASNPRHPVSRNTDTLSRPRSRRGRTWVSARPTRNGTVFVLLTSPRLEPSGPTSLTAC